MKTEALGRSAGPVKNENLQQCFEKALRLEASLQLSEGSQYGSKNNSYEC